MSKPDKGQYGYMKSYRLSKLIGVIVLALMIEFVVITTLIMYGDTKRVIIVIAILLALPLAKLFIGFILCVKFKPLSEDQYSVIHNKVKNGGKNLLFDVSISQYEGIKFYQSMFVKNGKIYALVMSKDFKENKKDYEKWITAAITGDKYKYKVVCLDDSEEYIKKVNSVSEPNDNNKLIDKFVIDEILSAGV